MLTPIRLKNSYIFYVYNLNTDRRKIMFFFLKLFFYFYLKFFFITVFHNIFVLNTDNIANIDQSLFLFRKDVMQSKE